MQNSSHFYKTLSGVKMPKLIYGTAWKGKKTADLVVEAVLAGFRGIDTACQPKHYQEDLVGEGLERLYTQNGFLREDIFIQTKFTSLDGQDPNKIPYDKNAELSDQVKQSFDKSLKNLQTDYLDSLLLHSPMETHKDTMTVWKVFEELFYSGRVKQLGISNIYSLENLKKIWNEVSVKPAVIQNRFYNTTLYDIDIREFCKNNGIIYQSFWSLTANPNILTNKNISRIANKHKITPEQVLFKFLIQSGIAPLTGTTNIKHMKQDLHVLDLEDFSENEMNTFYHLIGEKI